MKTNKEHIKEELRELQAENLLNQLNQSADIPEGYFENLSIDFLKTLNALEVKAPTKKVSLRNVFLSVSIAATLLMLLAGA